MSAVQDIAYQVDPVLWVRDKLKLTPMPWQDSFLRAPRGASILALTARQVGKTTSAAWAIAHMMVFKPGSLSVIACPTLRQSAEAVRRVREVLIQLGVAVKSDNVYAIELENGSRVLALPGSDDSIRGLTVDGWIVADEAARLSENLISALRPMRARRPETRFAMMSTAWSRTDPFWLAWSGDDPSWIRLKASADEIDLFAPAYLESERRNLGEAGFKREYLGIPGADQASPFTWELYERATRVHTPLVLPGPAFRQNGNDPRLDQPETWPAFHPLIIAHDVGRSRDRSTAVVGGGSPFQSDVVGIGQFEELPLGLYGSPRANALAEVDRRYCNNAFIVADLSNDASLSGNLVRHLRPAGDRAPNQPSWRWDVGGAAACAKRLGASLYGRAQPLDRAVSCPTRGWAGPTYQGTCQPTGLRATGKPPSRHSGTGPRLQLLAEPTR